MRSMSPAVLGATALLAALTLSGCANPIEQFIEDQTGVSVDTDGDGTVTYETEDGGVTAGDDVTVPDDFPASLAQPNGKLISVVTSNGSWSLQYTGIEGDEIERLRGLLADSGFEESFTSVGSGYYQGNWTTEEWVVTILWDGSDSSSKHLIYAATPAS